jgi:hypothetical protein
MQPGFLTFHYDVFSKMCNRNPEDFAEDSSNDLGLNEMLDRTWAGDAWEVNRVRVEGLEFDEEVTLEDLREMHDARMRATSAAKRKQRAAPTLAGREYLEALAKELDRLNARARKLRVDRAAASAAALPTPLELALPTQPREPLIADASATLYTGVTTMAPEHSTYVHTALLRRLRGLPLGRRWPAVEKLGAPLAALAGFRGPGEPGSAAALQRFSTPAIVCELFGASGSVEALEWLFEEACLFEVTGGVEALGQRAAGGVELF